MLLLGIGNSVGWGVMIAYLQLLSAKFDRTLQFTRFVVFVQAVPIIGRCLNATYWITIPHYIRMFYVVCFQCVSYGLLITTMIIPTETYGCNVATIAVTLFTFARVVGEATIVGYMKALPQELIATYGLGTGISDMLATCIMLTA